MTPEERVDGRIILYVFKYLPKSIYFFLVYLCAYPWLDPIRRELFWNYRSLIVIRSRLFAALIKTAVLEFRQRIAIESKIAKNKLLIAKNKFLMVTIELSKILFPSR